MTTLGTRAAICIAPFIVASPAMVWTSAFTPEPVAPTSPCLTTPTPFVTSQLSQIRRAVHPIQDPADSADGYRRATRLPAVDSLLVNFVTSDSLCEVAARRYGVVRFKDSTRVKSVTLIRVGNQGYVAMGVEGEVDMVGELFLYFTPDWIWRGGSVRPN